MAFETYESEPAVSAVRAVSMQVATDRCRTVYERFLKRPVDVVASLVLLIITAPLAMVVAIGVALTMGRPVIFKQQRLSRGGREFTMYKFRSMLPPKATGENDGGPSEFHAAPDSPRHTPFGQLIRRAALDELPQLWNVLKGDMSLIGPRPEMPEVAEAYDIVDHPRHLVRPGMTGAWQVSEFRDGFVHMHVHIDAAYVGNLTLRQDLNIAMRTIGVVLGGGGEKIRQDKLAAKEAAESVEELDLRDDEIDLRPIRVLHVLEPAFSGVPAYVEELGRGLADRGVEQVVLTSDEQEWDFERWPVEVVRRKWRRRPADAFRVAREIRHIVDDHDIDLVHAHATFAGVAARVRRLRVPLLYQPHGWGHLSTRRRMSARVVRSIEHALDGRSDVLLTLSEQEAADSPRRRPSERVRPIVDLSRFGPLSDVERRGARLEYGWASDQRVHLCVGELSHRKNQLPLAAAWRRWAGPADQLVFVGDGAARDALEGTDERVHILGWRDDIPRLMAAADTLVVPSRGEGFSLVILEALASGLPVFTTAVGGSEVITGNDGAIRGSVDDVVRAAVSSTLPDCEPLDRVLRAQRHQESASVDTVADDFVAIYRRTLARPVDVADGVVDLTSAEARADAR